MRRRLITHCFSSCHSQQQSSINKNVLKSVTFLFRNVRFVVREYCRVHVTAGVHVDNYLKMLHVLH